jgi:fatty acid desaturase
MIWTTLFALGTFWFWLLIVVSMTSIIALIENEQNVIADIIFVVTMLALYKLGCGTALATIGMWVAAHWFYSILIFLGYLLAGTAYSFIKWFIFLEDGRARIIREKSYFYESDWLPSENKSRITHWMIYWPLSGIWTMISNPVAKAFNRIFYRLESVYLKMSNKIMADLIEKKNNEKEQ